MIDSKRYSHVTLVGCRMRPFWVVRYQDDSITTWLRTESGEAGVLKWTESRELAHEHRERHDAYLARDDARAALQLAVDYVNDERWCDPANIKVMRGYR